MPGHVYTVRAVWDDEAKVWVATSDDVPGLATEARTMEVLIQKLRVMVPELLEANDCLPRLDHRTCDVPFELLAQYHGRIHIAHAP